MVAATQREAVPRSCALIGDRSAHTRFAAIALQKRDQKETSDLRLNDERSGDCHRLLLQDCVAQLGDAAAAGLELFGQKLMATEGVNPNRPHRFAGLIEEHHTRRRQPMQRDAIAVDAVSDVERHLTIGFSVLPSVAD